MNRRASAASKKRQPQRAATLSREGPDDESADRSKRQSATVGDWARFRPRQRPALLTATLMVFCAWVGFLIWMIALSR